MTVEPKVVIYIEDNLANLRLVEKLFARIPEVNLLSSSDGISGLNMVKIHRPSLVLLDINLPGISGYEVLANLKSSLDLRDIPVVAISASAMSRDIEMGMQAGFDDYLTKPIDVLRLVEVVNQYI